MADGRFITALHNHLQELNQRHLLTWKPSSEGPPDALVWTMECKVGGRVLGTGTGAQKRIAKDQAAQFACQTLGISV